MILTLHLHEQFRFFLKRLNSLTVLYHLNRNASIKDIIESIGIPHTEIGRIDRNGKEIDFSVIPRTWETVFVYPINQPFDVTQKSLLRPVPLDGLAFVVDENVGKLASLLRILGMDAVYFSGISDGEIMEFAEKEKRIVLSKDTELFKRKRIVFGRYVRSVHPYEQLREVLDFFGIQGPFSPFSRCLECNTLLEPINKETIIHRLEPKTKKYYHTFKICRACDKLVWRGSHCEKISDNMKAAGVYF